METLAPKLAAAAAEIATAPKEVLEMIESGLNLVQTKFGTLDGVIQVGSKMPAFTLSDATGTPVSSSSLLAKGPLLITFYRGNWCPYCNIALHALGERLDEIHAQGVELAAISPELPDTSLTTQEKNELKYLVLSDEGNAFARKLGIVWKQPETLRPLFESRNVVSAMPCFVLVCLCWIILMDMIRT